MGKKRSQSIPVVDEVDLYLKDINISEHFMWLVSENCQDNLESLGRKT